METRARERSDSPFQGKRAGKFAGKENLTQRRKLQNDVCQERLYWGPCVFHRLTLSLLTDKGGNRKSGKRRMRKRALSLGPVKGDDDPLRGAGQRLQLPAKSRNDRRQKILRKKVQGAEPR